MFLFDSIDKTQQSKLTFTLKSASFIAQEDILQNISQLKPEPLVYKKRPIHVNMYTVETPSHIHFIFESKQEKLFGFELKFKVKGLQMENSAENAWKFEVAPEEKLIRSMKRTEERGSYCFRIVLI